MGRLKNGSIPSYRYHKARNCAVVTIEGRDHYLGSFGSPSSRQKYAGLIRAIQNRREQVPVEPTRLLGTNQWLSINELILVYLRHISTYYKPNQGENKEAGCIADSLQVLQGCGYGPEPAESFRPKDLKIVREAMAKKNWSRTYINSQVNRVKRMFRHAVEEDLIPGNVYHALTAVKGLRKGTPNVRESKKVRPAPIQDIKAVLAKARNPIKSMILFAYHTGARPGEVCALKPVYLDCSQDVWVYSVPSESNKTEHHEQQRRIYIGPKAQRLLSRLMEGLQPHQYVFSPVRAEANRNQERRAQRKTPLWPAHVKCQAKKKDNPRRPKRECYDPASFRRAVNRLCDAARVPRWSPNRLRHNAGTRFRRRFGAESARALLGHRKLATTEIYAEVDATKAARAALRIG